MKKMIPSSFMESFYLDEHKLNKIPKGWLRKLECLLLSSRYSMPVLMRLSQFYYLSSEKAFTKMGRKFNTTARAGAGSSNFRLTADQEA